MLFLSNLKWTYLCNVGIARCPLAFPLSFVYTLFIGLFLCYKALSFIVLEISGSSLVSSANVLFFIGSSITIYISYEYNSFEKHSIIWNNSKHQTTIPFISSKTGHILIKAKINDELQYLLFDTGFTLCAFNEKYNTEKSVNTISIKDSHKNILGLFSRLF